MRYAVKPLGCDPRHAGKAYRENNSGGAVKRLNAIAEQLAALDFASAPVFVVNGLKREELIATNGTHQKYLARGLP
jgi:Fe-Mn family superoxide dismutase